MPSYKCKVRIPALGRGIYFPSCRAALTYARTASKKHDVYVVAQGSGFEIARTGPDGKLHVARVGSRSDTATRQRDLKNAKVQLRRVQPGTLKHERLSERIERMRAFVHGK